MGVRVLWLLTTACWLDISAGLIRKQPTASSNIPRNYAQDKFPFEESPLTSRGDSVSADSKPQWIYVLALEGHKWYVGKTNDVERRLMEHMDGRGSAFTRIHRPVELHTVFPRSTVFDEDKVVKQTMLAFGVENVRGGSHAAPILSFDQEKFLQAEMITANVIPDRGMIHVLRLQNGTRFVCVKGQDLEYVGWLQRNPPVKIETKFPYFCRFDLDLVTKMLMAQYGIDAVRGGSYSNEILTASQEHFLRIEVLCAFDRCFMCGEEGHYSHNCPHSRRAGPRQG